MLPKLAVGIGMIVLSFWLALTVLDRWVFVDRDQATSAASSRQPRLLFELDARRRNWTVANSKTRAVVVEKGIAVESSADTLEYQWLTDPIPVRANTDLEVSYKIDVIEGKIGIGVLDFASDRWIATKDVNSPSDSINFRTPSVEIQVILYGTGAPPSGAALSDLKVMQP